MKKTYDLDQGLGSKIYGLNGNMACAQIIITIMCK